MTSKNLFFNLIKEELKQKLWVIALTILMLFFLFPIFALMDISDCGGDIVALTRAFADVLSLQSTGIMVVTFTAAFLFALQGFSYLQSKKQIDLYHGIPVKRETFFAVKYICGAACYLIPFVLFSAISVIIFMVNGVPISEVINQYFIMLVVTSVFYLFLYVTIILAALLTGNKTISIFAAITLLSYSGIYFGMLYNMKRIFWVSSYQGAENINIFSKWTSPMVAYAATLQEATGGTVWSNVIIALLLTAVLTVLALFLHKKRSSESAGEAIAFPKIEPILKVLLVIPTSILGGIFFGSFSSHSLTWYAIGIILTFVLGSALIEIIFAFDIRKAFAHKKIWIVNATLLLVLHLFFVMDIGGYDTYLPAEEKVESMAVKFTFEQQQGQMFYMRDSNGSYIDMERLKLETMEIKEYQVLYDYTKEKIAENKQKSRLEIISVGTKYVDYRNHMIVKYHLKNGKDVYRRYTIDLQEEQDTIAKIYENPQYLSATHAISSEEEYTDMYLGDLGIETDYNKETRFSVTKEQVAELSKIYQEDILDLKLEIQKDMVPIGAFTLLGNGGERMFYLYSFCDKTIAYLQEVTGEELLLEKRIAPEDVISATASYVPEKELQDENFYAQADSYMQEDGYTQYDMMLEEWKITDPIKIQTILEEGIPSDFVRDNGYWEMGTDRTIDVVIEYKTNDTGSTSEISLCFQKGEIAESIIASRK